MNKKYYKLISKKYYFEKYFLRKNYKKMYYKIKKLLNDNRKLKKNIKIYFKFINKFIV